MLRLLFIVIGVFFILEVGAEELTVDEIAQQEISRFGKLPDLVNTETQFNKFHGNRKYFYGYAIRDLSRAYFLTQDDQYKNLAISLFDFYKKNYFHDGILLSEGARNSGVWVRNFFSREMYLLYQSYIYLGESSILKLVENQTEKWMQSVPRDYHRGYLVFPYGLKIGDSYSGKERLMTYEINPNQHFEVARLFSSLYFDEESKYFKSPRFKDIVLNEVSSALLLLKDDGRLSLREGKSEVHDSNYGGYASAILYVFTSNGDILSGQMH